jgi:four helix bundle protein
MNYHTYSFEKLEVWQLARVLKKDLYNKSKGFPKEEIYGLTSQLRRAIGSVTANLAEGSGRSTQADRANFINMAYASSLEVLDHLITAYDCNFLEKEDYEDYRLRLDELLNKLNAYYKYQLNRKENLKTKLRK